ncbi:MAG: hypothetical protein JWO67_1601 [Streptosporangiaceae bacterium]|nr:hypothetical protein [Streptosporangiaceae bacterium]
MGHLLSIETADWVPASHRGAVGGRLATSSNEPGDIGFVTVVQRRPGGQPLAGKRGRFRKSSGKVSEKRSRNWQIHIKTQSLVGAVVSPL